MSMCDTGELVAIAGLLSVQIASSAVVLRPLGPLEFVSSTFGVP